MRTGLVVVGLAITLAGGGLVASLFLIDVGETNALSSTATYPVLGGGGTYNSSIPLHASSGATFVLSWSSTGATNVTLWSTSPCAAPAVGNCVNVPALVNWPANESGRWSMSGTVVSEYVLSTRDVGPTNLNFTYTASEAYPISKAPLSPLAVSLILLGAGLLLGIGGIAVFLGLFLRGGVYARNPLDRRYPSIDPDDLDDPIDPTDDIDR